MPKGLPNIIPPPPPVLQGEEWREIQETRGIYSVSSSGRVRRNIGDSWRLLKQQVSSQRGYYAVSFTIGNRGFGRAVNRLVALAFLGPAPSAHHQVNHKDCNKLNNLLSNLEWVTPSENAQHAQLAGLCSHRITPRGTACPNAVLSESNVIEIRRRLDSPNTLAKRFNVSRRAVRAIQNGLNWKWLDQPHEEQSDEQR